MCFQKNGLDDGAKSGSMKISYNWLKDYLAIDLPAEEVAEVLTQIGLEVEGLEKQTSVEGGLEGLVVGHVLSAEQHPNADRLRVTKVDVGAEEVLDIVCGAPNVAAGQKVVVATVGTMLYPTEGEPFKIKKGKIRGEVSMGMICAEDEIGLGHEHDGIMVLPAEVKVGTPVREVIEIKEDDIIEIDLTPNRSDATCHIGVAKDLAAALKIAKGLDVQVKMPEAAKATAGSGASVDVVVNRTDLCPRYAGVVLTGLTVKESPEFIRERLEAIGVKTINNIVDVTNFILHEMGQPLHAFDADKIKGKKIVVDALPQDTGFVTLDGDERKLSEQDLIICDADMDGMCIAGVYGGLGTGVTDSTTSIFLESACFDAGNTRRTSKRHNLRTDAAMRFEKGVDPNGCVIALKRAVDLILESAGGVVSSEFVDIYPEPIAPKEIRLKYRHVTRLLGIDIPAEEIREILAALEIEILSSDEESMLVRVPSNKTDVYREADVIEEILRIYGIDRVPLPATIQSSIAYEQKPNGYKVEQQISDFLASRGLQEIVAPSVSKSKYYSEEEQAGGMVSLLNSMNSELDAMRMEMCYSGLEVIHRNQNHKNNDLALFEFGKTYRKEEGAYIETRHLTCYICGRAAGENWKEQPAKADFYDIKRTVDELVARLGLKINATEPCEESKFVYGMLYKSQNRPLVKFGRLAEPVLKKLSVKGPVFYAEFDVKQIMSGLKSKKVKFAGLNKFPSMRRDLALVIDEQVKFESIRAMGMKAGKHILQDINLFDIFQDEEKLGVGKKSYSVSYLFQDAKKTLKDGDVDRVMNKLMKQYEEQLGAIIRK